MKHYDYLVVGAGLYGAVFAYEAPVVDAGADDRKAERHIDAFGEAHVLERRESLVMVHAEDGIPLFHFAGNEDRVGGKGPNDIRRAVAGALQSGTNYRDFLRPHVAVFAGMRVEPRDRNRRMRDGVGNLKLALEDCEDFVEKFRRDGVGDRPKRQMRRRERYLEGVPAGRGDEHHDDARNACGFRKEFRVAREAEACFNKDALLNRRRDDGACCALRTKPVRGSKRFDDVGGIFERKLPRDGRFRERHMVKGHLGGRLRQSEAAGFREKHVPVADQNDGV